MFHPSQAFFGDDRFFVEQLRKVIDFHLLSGELRFKLSQLLSSGNLLRDDRLFFLNGTGFGRLQFLVQRVVFTLQCFRSLFPVAMRRNSHDGHCEEKCAHQQNENGQDIAYQLHLGHLRYYRIDRPELVGTVIGIENLDSGLARVGLRSTKSAQSPAFCHQKYS